MASSATRTALVIGASGNVDKSTSKALLAEAFEVTGLTRESSQAAFAS